MELLGENLETLYEQYKPLSTATIMKIGLQIVKHTKSIHFLTVGNWLT